MSEVCRKATAAAQKPDHMCRNYIVRKTASAQLLRSIMVVACIFAEINSNAYHFGVLAQSFCIRVGEIATQDDR